MKKKDNVISVDFSIHLASALEPLRHERIWLLWREERSADDPEKPRKVPYYENGDKRHGTLDSPKDRAQLVTFDQARKKLISGGSYWCGLGIALGPLSDGRNLAGIDLDDAIQNRKPSARAQELRASGLYCEETPGCAGYHLLGYGHPEKRGSKKGDGLEVYPDKRYFTYTGAQATGELGDIEPVAEQARHLWNGSAPPSEATDTDEPIPNHQRHDRLMEIGGRLHDAGIKGETLKGALRGINELRCTPPVGLLEVDKMSEWYNAKLSEGWADPLNFLRDPIAPPYLTSDLPPVLGDFVAAYSQASGLDPSLGALSSVVATAAMIDARFRLEVDQRTNWHESALLWGINIGPPGSGKTPAQNALMDPLVRQHTDLASTWQAAVAALEEGARPPPQPKLILTNTTVEAIPAVLETNPHGIVLWFDEFESLLGSFDTYRTSGGASKDRGEYLSLFQGGPLQSERVGRGSVWVPNWGASILASTTPATLRKVARALPNDGLLQRFLVSVVRRASPPDDGVSTESELKAYASRLRTLFRLEPRMGTAQITFTDGARELFDDFKAGLNVRLEAASTISDGYESAVSKYPTQLARLSLVFHFVTARDPIEPIRRSTVEMALHFLERADIHAMVMYSTIATVGGPATIAREVARTILRSDHGDTIDRRDITRYTKTFAQADDRERDRAMALLEDYSWVKAVRGDKGTYDKGHPTRWKVNPKLRSVFAKEREIEIARSRLEVAKLEEATAARRSERNR